MAKVLGELREKRVVGDRGPIAAGPAPRDMPAESCCDRRPFAEAKELVAGFAIVTVDAKAKRSSRLRSPQHRREANAFCNARIPPPGVTIAPEEYAAWLCGERGGRGRGIACRLRGGIPHFKFSPRKAGERTAACRFEAHPDV